MADKFLIYGATGGIGEVLCRRLAADGHALNLVARDAARLRALADALGATYTAVDVLQPDAFALVAAEAGRALAGQVYAVGSINLKPFVRLTVADFERDFQLNAAGAALAMQAALPALRASGGRSSVVLFSSVAAGRGFPMHASIGMAKAAVEGLMRALANKESDTHTHDCAEESDTHTHDCKQSTTKVNTRMEESDTHTHDCKQSTTKVNTRARLNPLDSAWQDHVKAKTSSKTPNPRHTKPRHAPIRPIESGLS